VKRTASNYNLITRLTYLLEIIMFFFMTEEALNNSGDAFDNEFYQQRINFFH
jgi:hypothetical protein